MSADGVSLTPSNVFGRLPYNDRIADSTFRNHDFAVNRVVSKIVFRVEDITDLSEIYIDQITVSAIPEPTSALLLALGVSAIALGRRNRSKTGDVS